MKSEPLKGKLTHIKLTPYYIDALKGAIIEKYQKQGVTDIQKLQNYIDKELPQLICDEVNSAINMLELDVRSAVEWLKEQIRPEQPDKTYKKVMNTELQALGCDTRAKVHTFTVIKSSKVLDLIDEAFADCVKKGIR